MSYYEKHVFLCTYQRDNDRACCANSNASELLKYAKAKIKALGKNGKGQIRINNAGCMDRCNEGPVLVVYPDAVWYRYETLQDIDDIINQHILQGQRVERLLLKN